jgi:Methylase involved in ubiquinone/menaquinone biosynthesis
MTLNSPQKELYAKERLGVLEAKRLAHEISFGPMVFQISRLMVQWGIFEHLLQTKGGCTLEEVAQQAQISPYAAKILLESSLTIGSVLLKDGKFTLSKTGWFLLKDPLVRVNMDFNHDVNYLGLFYLDQALQEGRPAGLQVFGDWPTIYEGLSQLPEQVQKSWFGFDHFYSDSAFNQALELVFSRQPKRLLDVGGNTGRWALRCVRYNPEVEITIMDLPQQLELMRVQLCQDEDYARIHGHGANLLDKDVAFPKGFDAIWMSQFLDCFSEEEVVSILSRAARAMDPHSRLYIMETLWDRQQYEDASYCLTQISVYFTALANGNSKMYSSGDMERCIQAAGLEVENIESELGFGHSLICCKRT